VIELRNGKMSVNHLSLRPWFCANHRLAFSTLPLQILLFFHFFSKNWSSGADQRKWRREGEIL